MASCDDSGRCGVGDRSPAPHRVVAAVVAAATCVALMATPAAGWAHGGGSTDYSSRVERIEPSGLEMTAVVEDNDDRLRVTWRGDGELVILGYADEPYARIGPDGVHVNRNSGAYHANEERYGGDVPDGVGEGEPEWVRQDTDEPTFEFHDHRIHWMLRSPPPQVDADDPARQQVFEWAVPFTVDGEPGTIDGTLFYVGGEEPGAPGWVIAAAITGGLVAFVAIALVLRRRLRRRRLPTTATRLD